MSIARRVRSVELLYARLDKEIAQFQSTTKLHCIAGCGKCCTKPDIEASPLEFLPWAFQQFLEGRALEALDRVKKSPSSICILFSSVVTGRFKQGQVFRVRPSRADMPLVRLCGWA